MLTIVAAHVSVTMCGCAIARDMLRADKARGGLLVDVCFAWTCGMFVRWVRSVWREGENADREREQDRCAHSIWSRTVGRFLLLGATMTFLVVVPLIRGDTGHFLPPQNTKSAHPRFLMTEIASSPKAAQVEKAWLPSLSPPLSPAVFRSPTATGWSHASATTTVPVQRAAARPLATSAAAAVQAGRQQGGREASQEVYFRASKWHFARPRARRGRLPGHRGSRPRCSSPRSRRRQ